MFSPNQQMPINAKLLSVQLPSPVNYVGQNDSPNLARDGFGNGAFSQAESLVYSSKKLENEILFLGKKIKHHEDNIKYLMTHRSSLDDMITDIQVAIGHYHSSSSLAAEAEDLSIVRNEEATVECILQHEKSAAGVVCELKRRGNQATQIPTTKDVLGVVATLGKVNDVNLSRLLSEYVGLDTMLALVCMTNDGVKALETYDKDGSISKRAGLYGLGASIGRTLDGPFTVISLESLRPYVGEFMPDDPQRRLALLKPKLPNGETPTGFLGFAVNMILVDSAYMSYLTTKGYGLRETLFYSLFSRLQVYRTRADMLRAFPCICDGAISLDCGMIRSNGMFSLGSRKEIDVNFPIVSRASYLSEDYVATKERMKELTWKRERMTEDLHREEAMLTHVKFDYENKKQEFIMFMAQSSPYTMQYPMQAAYGRSTPR